MCCKRCKDPQNEEKCAIKHEKENFHIPKCDIWAVHIPSEERRRGTEKERESYINQQRTFCGIKLKIVTRPETETETRPSLTKWSRCSEICRKYVKNMQMRLEMLFAMLHDV